MCHRKFSRGFKSWVSSSCIIHPVSIVFFCRRLVCVIHILCLLAVRRVDTAAELSELDGCLFAPFKTDVRAGMHHKAAVKGMDNVDFQDLEEVVASAIKKLPQHMPAAMRHLGYTGEHAVPEGEAVRVPKRVLTEPALPFGQLVRGAPVTTQQARQRQGNSSSAPPKELVPDTVQVPAPAGSSGDAASTPSSFTVLDGKACASKDDCLLRAASRGVNLSFQHVAIRDDNGKPVSLGHANTEANAIDRIRRQLRTQLQKQGDKYPESKTLHGLSDLLNRELRIYKPAGKGKVTFAYSIQPNTAQCITGGAKRPSSSDAMQVSKPEQHEDLHRNRTWRGIKTDVATSATSATPAKKLAPASKAASSRSVADTSIFDFPSDDEAASSHTNSTPKSAVLQLPSEMTPIVAHWTANSPVHLLIASRESPSAHQHTSLLVPERKPRHSTAATTASSNTDRKQAESGDEDDDLYDGQHALDELLQSASKQPDGQQVC